jgi:hypothetical protein
MVYLVLFKVYVELAKGFFKFRSRLINVSLQ